MPSVMRLLGALGGLESAELRATFNGGIGMLFVVAQRAVEVVRAAAPEAVLVGDVATAAELGGRYVEAPLDLIA
jgi:phosphoribosylaminoimidazole (AIR) synthetase